MEKARIKVTATNGEAGGVGDKKRCRLEPDEGRRGEEELVGRVATYGRKEKNGCKKRIFLPSTERTSYRPKFQLDLPCYRTTLKISVDQGEHTHQCKAYVQGEYFRKGVSVCRLVCYLSEKKAK